MDKLYDSEAEATWISSGIYHPEYLRVENNMKPDFFYDKVNKCLVWAIQKLAVENGIDNIDIINLESMLSTNGAVKRVVDQKLGDKGLTDFVNNAQYAARPTYDEFKISENTIKAYSLRRDVLGFASALEKMCKNDNATIEQINDYCTNGLQKILDKYIFGEDSCEIGQKIDEIWEEIVSKRTSTGYGIPFCLPRLNDFVSLVPGEMTVLIGETGKGKSSFFLVQALYTVFHCGIGTLIIDSELTDDVWLPRALASLSGVPVWKIKTGKFDSKEEEDKFKKAYKRLKESHLTHYYMPSFNRLEMEQLFRKWVVGRNYGLVIWDYLKPTEGHYESAAISQDLGLQADFVKGLTGKMQVPCLAGQQQNEDTKEAADSKKVRRYVDTQLYWEEKTEEEITENPESGNFKIRVGKNRNGASTNKKNYIDVNFEQDCMRISEAKMHKVNGGSTPFD